MTFGRPTMASSLSILPETLDITAPSGANIDHEQLRLLFHRESLRLGVILEGMLQKIYQPWLNRDTSTDDSGPTGLNIHHSLDAVIELQTQLSSFEQTVTPCLSWISPTISSVMDIEDQSLLEMQRNVLHARQASICNTIILTWITNFYRFLYMLLILHRPILTQLSIPETTESRGTNEKLTGAALLSSNGLRNSFALECGKSCVEAAKRLIRLIHDIYQTDVCDAWWWNALCKSLGVEL